MSIRTFAAIYLLVQSVGVVIWWAVLLLMLESRAYFRTSDSPDVTLLAFIAADGLLIVGAGSAAAFGLLRNRPWAWPVLCVHAGAGGYAALYCLALTAMTSGEAWLAAAMMAPSLVVPPILAIRLRPGVHPPC